MFKYLLNMTVIGAHSYQGNLRKAHTNELKKCDPMTSYSGCPLLRDTCERQKWPGREPQKMIRHTKMQRKSKSVVIKLDHVNPRCAAILKPSNVPCG